MLIQQTLIEWKLNVRGIFSGRKWFQHYEVCMIRRKLVSKMYNRSWISLNLSKNGTTTTSLQHDSALSLEGSLEKAVFWLKQRMSISWIKKEKCNRILLDRNARSNHWLNIFIWKSYAMAPKSSQPSWIRNLSKPLPIMLFKDISLLYFTHIDWNTISIKCLEDRNFIREWELSWCHFYWIVYFLFVSFPYCFSITFPSTFHNIVSFCCFLDIGYYALTSFFNLKKNVQTKKHVSLSCVQYQFEDFIKKKIQLQLFIDADPLLRVRVSR